MKLYHKIQSVFKRDEKTKFKTFLMGDYSIPEFEYLKDDDWIFTEKVDRTNVRVMFENNQIVFGGSNTKSILPPRLLKKLQSIFSIEKLGAVFDSPVCLHGEGYGGNIQKLGSSYIPDGCDFVLFDIRVGDFYLSRENLEQVASQLNIAIVPLVGHGTLNDAVAFAKNGYSSSWGNFVAEGIVLKPKVELFSRTNGRLITKIKHSDFATEKINERI